MRKVLLTAWLVGWLTPAFSAHFANPATTNEGAALTNVLQSMTLPAATNEAARVSANATNQSLKLGGYATNEVTRLSTAISNGTVLRVSPPLSISSGYLQFEAASSDTDGYLKGNDWSYFYAKQPNLGFTPLTPQVTTNVSEKAAQDATNTLRANILVTTTNAAVKAAQDATNTLSGAAVVNGTINSNKLDTATRAMLGVSGGAANLSDATNHTTLATNVLAQSILTGDGIYAGSNTIFAAFIDDAEGTTLSVDNLILPFASSIVYSDASSNAVALTLGTGLEIVGTTLNGTAAADPWTFQTGGVNLTNWSAEATSISGKAAGHTLGWSGTAWTNGPTTPSRVYVPGDNLAAVTNGSTVTFNATAGTGLTLAMDRTFVISNQTSEIAVYTNSHTIYSSNLLYLHTYLVAAGPTNRLMKVWDSQFFAGVASSNTPTGTNGTSFDLGFEWKTNGANKAILYGKTPANESFNVTAKAYEIWETNGLAAAGGGGGGDSVGVLKIGETNFVGPGTEFKIRTTSTAVTGGMIVLVLFSTDSTGTAFSGSDPSANTYTLNVATNEPNADAAVIIASAPVSTQLGSGSDITCTALANYGYHALAYYVTNVTEIDRVACSQNGWTTAGNNHPTGTTSAITGSDDAAFAAWIGYGSGSESWTVSDYTTLDTPNPYNRKGVVAWKNVTSGTQSATATYSASGQSAAAIAVFK